MSINEINSVLIENRQFAPTDDFTSKARIKAAETLENEQVVLQLKGKA